METTKKISRNTQSAMSWSPAANLLADVALAAHYAPSLRSKLPLAPICKKLTKLLVAIAIRHTCQVISYAAR